MPGAPYSRACDECRKQKKKCDQLEPHCSRCARLCLPCTGSNEQRYIFKHETPARRTSRKLRSRYQASAPIKLLNDQMTLLRGSFISAIEVADLRYSLSAYVPFSRFIPQRLGNNEALDASVRAITTTHASIHADTLPPQVFTSYGRALKSLRICLDNPIQVASVETMTAIYLVMVCQGWIDGKGAGSGQQVSHVNILVHIINAATNQDWKGDFEVEMLLSLTSLVLLSSAFNPSVTLDPWYPKVLGIEDYHEAQLRDNTPPCIDSLDEPGLGVGKAVEALQIRTLGTLATILRQPETHLIEVQTLYKLAQADYQEMRQSITIITGMPSPQLDNIASQPKSSIQDTPLLTHYQSAYSALLCLVLTLNAVLHAFCPGEHGIVEENRVLSSSIIQFGQYMSQYRPLGASSIPPALIAVIALAVDESKQIEAEAILKEYSTDFKGMKWMDSAIWLRAVINHLRAKLEVDELLTSGDEFQLAVAQDLAAQITDPGPPPYGGCYVQ